MIATVRNILNNDTYPLRLVTGERFDNDGVSNLDTPVTWAHSTNIADPTPFTETGQLLINDGATFVGVDDAGEYERYIRRLVNKGIVALGYGVDVYNETIPAEIVRQCERYGLPLIEVPYQVPFMGIIRIVADMKAKERQTQQQWILETIQRMSLATLKSINIRAPLTELANRLDCWVAIFDQDAVLIEQADTPTNGRDLHGDLVSVTGEVRKIVQRGVRSAATVMIAERTYLLQTMGKKGAITGVIVIGRSTGTDRFGREVIENAAAMVSLVLDDSRNMSEALFELRSGYLDLALSGSFLKADHSAQRTLGSGFPEPPYTVWGFAKTDDRSPWSQLGRRLSKQPKHLFYGGLDDIVIVMSGRESDEWVSTFAADNSLRAGRVVAADYADLPQQVEMVKVALEKCTEDEPVVDYSVIKRTGIRDLLSTVETGAFSESLLAPLSQLDSKEYNVIRKTLYTWLKSNGHWDVAARELGVHRHTVRNRIATAARVLALDLEDFETRAEVWFALTCDD